MPAANGTLMTLTGPLLVVLAFVRMLVCGREPLGYCY